MLSTTPLARTLSHECAGTIQRRGAEYFARGRVQIAAGSATRVLATVRGTSTYAVELTRDGNAVRVSCTCPYFDVEVCKHIWAVILAADAGRLLRGDGRGGPLHLVHADDGPDDDDGGGLDESDDSDNGDEHGLRSYDFVASPRDLGTRLPTGRLPSSPRRYASPPPQISAETASWRAHLARLRSESHGYAAQRDEWRPGRELLYVIDIAGSRAAGGLLLDIVGRDPRKDGTWSKPKPPSITRKLLQRIPGGDDRHILSCLAGAASYEGVSAYPYHGMAGDFYSPHLPLRYRLGDPLLELTLPALVRTGRCRLRLHPHDEEPEWLLLSREDQDPWQFRVEVCRGEGMSGYELRGGYVRGAQHMNLTAPLLLVNGGLLFTRESVSRFEPRDAFEWISLLREHGPIQVPLSESEAFLAELLQHPHLPPLELPEELRYEEIRTPPRPRLAVKRAAAPWQRERLHAKLSFDYEGAVVTPEQPGRCIVQRASRRVFWRDRPAELVAGERLRELGWRAPAYPPRDDGAALELPAHRLPKIAHELLREGWHVEAEGSVYRRPGRFDIGVTSGIDWFELHGTLEFGGTVARLPELLAAIRRGEKMVRLGDGSLGLLPEEWLKKYGLLAGLGAAHDDHLRFTRSQAGLLDALLSTQPEARCDTIFTRLRDELRAFSGIGPVEPPAGFTGALRPYQKEGLGWFGFLRRVGFGGCLADDMGLGKTVQVLALLEARRELFGKVEQPTRGNGHPPSSQAIGPSLVVVPKSLIFNWKEEAVRFAPRLRVLDHTGPQRLKGNAHFRNYDLVLTTYGTLRRDVVEFKDVRFDYVILDEAQTIKNPMSASAKAARLLGAGHRLALSGTPIENHLGELFSLMEFLNPGLLGAASVFKLTQGALRDPDEETRQLLAHAVRPFVLRRTKEQVIQDLPPKVEQTLYCELESRQRRLYDELRGHYRKALLKRIERQGLARSKIQILEALLRLRQAALHPGLLDERRERDACAKLEVLLPRLREVRQEGHKALVFSQFTSMLAILRRHLEREALPYAYLDGSTHDRKQIVARFQAESECRIFLISLKAGGLGLNLTAAQYVFLLDPWWNPAIEAQAIDRAHRIGQTNQVFAYRLIARGTIEEKVLELQTVKRDLADAIIGADKGLIRNLGKEDLERLLS